MKKILFVLLLGLLLSACAPKAQPAAEPTPAALGSEPVTIRFWHCASDNAGVLMDKYIREFNESNPWQITVEGAYQGQYSDATTLMKTILSAENYEELPDIMQLDATGKVDYFNSGRAFTIDAAEAAFGESVRDAFLPVALGNWQYSGTQLGLPFSTSTTITYYNMDLLRQAGWNKGPETFEEIIQLSGDMKAAGLSAAAYAAIPNTPTLANWLGQLGSSVVNQANGTEGPATALDCLENGALLKFTQAWKELYDSGALVNENYTENHFITGEVAVFTLSSSKLNNILTKVGDSFEVGTGEFPRLSEDAAHGAGASGSSLVLFDSGSSLKKAAAWEFMKYLTSEAVQVDFASGTGYVPSLKSALESEAYQTLLAEKPQMATAGQQLLQTAESMRSVTVGPAVDFYNTILSAYSEMLASGTSAEDAAAALSKSLQSLLDNWTRMNQ